ncbi:MAG TPA: class I SAM-dependent methyltransferase [Minicystis sp.]|nr:class I SAM-dependent methyltransferase [Minicystis sp.]
MDILKTLSDDANYSSSALQLILGSWVVGNLFERRNKIETLDGHVLEEDYDKRSIYALFYSLYRSMGVVRSDAGVAYELTFNTWGYTWPEGWGEPSASADDPQRFGRNAYAGLFAFDAVKQRVRELDGRVHVVEMGCGTGAGAHHVCSNVLPRCTYEAVDMQRAAIDTCRRRFVPELDGRLVATHANCTRLPVPDGVADIVAVCETHVTDQAGRVTSEDEAFFRTAHRVLKPGGFLVWGNAIPKSTWEPCFAFLDKIGMELVEVRDVTANAIQARDEDAGRVDAYVEQCLDAFVGFKIPVLGARRRKEARAAMTNFYRQPGTRLYENMKDGTDTYNVVLLRKRA